MNICQSLGGVVGVEFVPQTVYTGQNVLISQTRYFKKLVHSELTSDNDDDDDDESRHLPR